MKILNLYAGLGGNRELWSGHEVTAVEIDPAIAMSYAQRFPDDRIVIGNAHSYLEEHFSEFDFVWSSPPCPTHGQYRYNVGYRAKGYKPVMPDMTLYAEIIFLMGYCSDPWCVENVVPFYDYLIKPSAVIQRHPIWSNFPVPGLKLEADNLRTKNALEQFDLDISGTKIKNKRQALRNRVDPRIGAHVLKAAIAAKEARDA